MEATEKGLETLKALSRSEALFPKTPIINAKTGKRQDGRDCGEIRPIFVQTGVRSGAKGSSYIEMGNTKVICVVQGPKDLPKKVDFSSTGLLAVDVQLTGGKVPEKDIILLKESLEAVILMDKFPKCMLEIYLSILEDGGSSIAACITAAGLAVIDGGIPIFDTVVGSTLLYDGSKFFMDPTRAEIQALDLTEPETNKKGGGVVTMGYLPSREQVCLFTMEGKMDPQTVAQAMDCLTNSALKIFTVVRKHSVDVIKEMDCDK